MRVEDAFDVVARRVHRAVDDEAGLVDGLIGAPDDVAVEVDLDQARGGDLAEMQTVGIDEEMVGRTWYARRDMGEDEIVHAEMRDQPIAGGEFDAHLLLGQGVRRGRRAEGGGGRHVRYPGADTLAEV